MKLLMVGLSLLFSTTCVYAQAPVDAPAALPPAVETAVAAAPAPDAQAPMAAASVIDADKKALILKFIEVFGTRKALEQNFELMLSEMPADKPEEVKQLRERVRVDEIIEQLLPIYDRNFTTEDLKGFIAFYDSPQGHVLLDKIPVLMKESVEISAKYLEGKFPEMKEKPEAAMPEPMKEEAAPAAK